ncbi:hypothetical protein [Paractinoplanes rishiriensis]|uniref:Uncharacterized protein n=1 Tax=Paractinoplanes rishiriensis TaxID=1050105 RepID=A0A919K1T3_9ACTN|nr:hypothetical protein [Actinoplanes rishiriensis]GIE97264.1 hypothetical protein Ari01nite_47290 [Actinoplanes rishiriensis]
MTSQTDLERLDQEIAELEPQVTEARRRIGRGEDGPTDGPELAQTLTEIEQQEAILARLRERRDQLSAS